VSAPDRRLYLQVLLVTQYRLLRLPGACCGGGCGCRRVDKLLTGCYGRFPPSLGIVVVRVERRAIDSMVNESAIHGSLKVTDNESIIHQSDNLEFLDDLRGPKRTTADR